MFSDLFLSMKRYLHQHFGSTSSLPYPHWSKRANALDIPIFSIAPQGCVPSEYPRSFLEEVLDDFQLEHVDGPGSWLEEVREGFIDFMAQQRPVPNSPAYNRIVARRRSKLRKSRRTNSIHSWVSKISMPTTEACAKISSDSIPTIEDSIRVSSDSSEFSTVHTDEENIVHNQPSISSLPPPLPVSRKPRQGIDIESRRMSEAVVSNEMVPTPLDI
ncbi:hypothetical protein K7432_009318 [Basidiobolus ranarum]|uniref:Uncharacterized protein n=1 Tax=Basidiobolus ranarum TaxID=34480 RepID=A0ABR2VXM6_9FUNG